MSSINSPQDFSIAALCGYVQGVSALVIAARSSAIQILQAPLTVGSNNLIQLFAAGAESWEILSSSANDTAAGTGARTVAVQYLDADYLQRTVVVTLNGATPVAIAADCFRHQLTTVMSAGSTNNNVGNLTIRVAGGGATRAFMPLTFGVTRQGSFTVPAGHRAIIGSSQFIISKLTGLGTIGTLSATVRDPSGVVRQGLDFTLSEPGVNLAFPLNISVPEKSTLIYNVTAVSANDTDVSVLTSGLLINTSLLKWPQT